jgi:hypothetical protein
LRLASPETGPSVGPSVGAGRNRASAPECRIWGFRFRT